MSDAWLGFLGGILAVLVGGLIASLVQRVNEARQKKAQLRVDTYFLLVDLKNWYFWVVTAELHGEEPRTDVLENCRKLAFQINDKLRALDDVEQLEESLTIIFSEAIPTARERDERLTKLLGAYGKIVSPRYSAIVERISEENLRRHGPNPTPPINAPGSFRYLK